MKLSIATAFAFVGAVTATSIDKAADDLIAVHLPEPLNWLPSDSLYPGRVIDGFSAPFDRYEPEAWGSYVRDQCRDNRECTVSASYSATGSGGINNTEDPFWFGWIFNGGKATFDDFMRSPGTENSAGYTIRE